LAVGSAEGNGVGVPEGRPVGKPLGSAVGKSVGSDVGCQVGGIEGTLKRRREHTRGMLSTYYMKTNIIRRKRKQATKTSSFL